MDEDTHFYMEQLMDNYKNPQNKEKLEDYTFLFRQKNASCGDIFEIYVKLDEKKEFILDVKYEGEGCAISTASMSLLSQELKGMKYEKAKKLIPENVYEILGVKISPGRINCALLSLNAFLNGAIKYESDNDCDK